MSLAFKVLSKMSCLYEHLCLYFIFNMKCREIPIPVIYVSYFNHIWQQLKMILVLLSEAFVVLPSRYQKWRLRFFFSTFHGQLQSAFPNFICTRNLAWHHVTFYQQRSDCVTVHGCGIVRAGLSYVPLSLKSESLQKQYCEEVYLYTCICLHLCWCTFWLIISTFVINYFNNCSNHSLYTM